MPDSKIHVLLVDDDEPIRRIMGKELAHGGLEVETAGDVASAREWLKDNSPDVVVLDVRLPGESGDEFLPEIIKNSPGTPVIMLTGHADVDLAIDCMKKGATDFLTKPCSIEHLKLTIQRAADEQQVRDQAATYARHARPSRPKKGAIIGDAKPIKRLLEIIERVAPTDETILVQGESGTGKELIAQEIQRRSRRDDKPFLTVNCAAVTETLLESELFGHEKGAFSGADSKRLGFFELADGGSIFLDEIGDMPSPMQAKLLRVLQSGELRRVGGSKTLHVDVRVIAATNRDLDQAVRDGEFREDLLHRINTIVLKAPSLRDRREDIPLLVEAFLKELDAEMGGTAPRIAEPAMKLLMNYSWPGNVRELRNIVRRTVILAPGDCIEPEDLPPHIMAPSIPESDSKDTADLTMGEVERRHYMRVYEAAGRNKAEAARRLGVSIRTLYNKFEAWGVQGDDEGAS